VGFAGAEEVEVGAVEKQDSFLLSSRRSGHLGLFLYRFVLDQG
jgi:hypothetical protein